MGRAEGVRYGGGNNLWELNVLVNAPFPIISTAIHVQCHGPQTTAPCCLNAMVSAYLIWSCLSLPPSLPLPLFLWPLLSFLSLSGTIDVPAQILRVLTPPPKHNRHGVPARLAHDALRAVPERVTLKFSVKMASVCNFSFLSVNISLH